MDSPDQAGVRLWRCPHCDRPLTNPRFAPVGCLGVVMAIGECPMHRSILPRAHVDDLRSELAGLVRS